MTKTATHRDRRMLALMNDDRHRGLYATRARRRGLVTAHVALSAALLGALWALPGDHGWPLYAVLPALLVLLAVWCTITGALNLATRGLLELRARVLDERQLADRGRVLAVAHRASLALQLAVLFGLYLAHAHGDARLSVPFLLGTLFALLVAHWLLPLWIATLTAPDDPADDVVDELP
ncbi:hypothetical protein F0L17_16290 [Streptomyces sp. TRM43335]|uniref:Uncharacterized protein n=1 Tax=Streptomyces taklimakanensis TaxID=2569853 RepID=A0A6G2BEY6_9ACTN|nr:hypothetical protein [Streptomyces taklimakanensis]MTE20639.1 hypothetical protein [Streptomyces taklimakanensis]